MYERALIKFLEDDALTEAEATNLLQLQRLLGITNTDLDEIEKRIVHPVYNRALGEVLSDEIVEPRERERLEKLRQALRLDEEKATTLYASRVQEVMQGGWSDALRDRRLSDDELRLLENRAHNLGATLKLDETDNAQIDRFRTFWRMENGIYPELEAAINLQRKEKCYFSTDATWYEKRTVTKAVRYGGPAISVKIVKGLYYRAGSYQVQRVTQEETQQVSSGTFYITSKRIVFHGQPKNASIRFNNIISFIPYADGIEIEKTSGRNPIFTFGDGEYASVLLGALLARD
jgi:hypothetical protein